LCLNMSQGRLSNIVRLVCADTCGCTDPRSAYLFAEELPYCAASCMTTAKFRRRHDKIDCVDMPPHELRQTKWWGLNAERFQWQQDHKSSFTALSAKQLMLDYGCSAVLWAGLLPLTNGFEFQLCDGFSEQGRTFWRSTCPQACNCTRNFRHGCPPKCKP